MTHCLPRYVCCIFVLAYIFQYSSAQNPYISSIINEVNIDSLVYRVEEISGYRGVVVNGVTDTIHSRNRSRPGNELAFKFIREQLMSYGLEVDSGLFGANGKNIWGIKQGSLYPSEPYIICAHYDGMPNQAIAPAADDDGSGVGAVLEAARVLSDYTFEHTIIFALWDEEEYGLAGSYRYATDAFNNGDTIAGVINMDAIAWDSDNDQVARVHAKPTGNSEIIADTVLAINTAYAIGLDMQLNNPGATYSDHASFWNRGYGAVLMIQDWDNDPNPHYHLVSDSIIYFNLPYYHKLSRLSIASVAALAVPVGYIGIEEGPATKLPGIYPNPAHDMLNIQLHEEYALMQISDLYGKILSSRYMTNKYSQVQADVSAYAPGIYFLTLYPKNGDTPFTKKFIKQ